MGPADDGEGLRAGSAIDDGDLPERASAIEGLREDLAA